MKQNQAGFSGEPIRLVDTDLVRSWFEEPRAVEHYARAAVRLGLWRSEQTVFEQVFDPEDRILDVGCGTGRVSFGLWRLGFRRISGVDYSCAMVAQAREIASELGCPFDFRLADVRHLPDQDGVRDGAIFGFNGLMQIPGQKNRRLALRELARVVRPGGRLVFTTHDRGLGKERSWWKQEARRWQTGRRNPSLVEFGDRVFENPEGKIFMHLPDREEVLDDLASAGWENLEDHLRSDLANENADVRAFSDECRFWIARRPNPIDDAEDRAAD